MLVDSKRGKRGKRACRARAGRGGAAVDGGRRNAG